MRVIQTASETLIDALFPHRPSRLDLGPHRRERRVVERLSLRRLGQAPHSPTAPTTPTGSITSQTTRGFTGEEELSVGGLVHLNGRVYDPLLARMTSADPTVTDPMNTQGWNRYSYVGNDPLAFTDPNGFSWLSSFFRSVGSFFNSIGHFISQNWRTIVQIVVNVALQAVGVPYFLAAAASAALGTGLSGGNLGQMLKSAAIAAVTAVAFHAIGPVPAFADAPGQYLERVGENALVGCGSSVASGGSCGSGAASAAVSAGLSPYLPRDLIGGTIARATVGGLASVAGGGKFANGAVTGAFQYLATASLESARESSNGRDSYAAFDANIAKTAVSLWDRWPDIWDALGHTFIQNAWATSLREAGYTVEKEVRLFGPGAINPARADIMYKSNDGTSRCECVSDWGIIDIKTPRHPYLSDQQENAYKAFNSGTAYSDASRITSFGYLPGQILPAGSVNIIGPYRNERTLWPPGSFGP